MIKTAVVVLVVLCALFAASKLLQGLSRWPWDGDGGGGGGEVSVVMPPPSPPPPPPPEPDPIADGRLEVVVTGKGYQVDGTAITVAELELLLEKTRDAVPEHERAVRLSYTRDARMFDREAIERMIKKSGLECVLEKKY